MLVLKAGRVRGIKARAGLQETKNKYSQKSDRALDKEFGEAAVLGLFLYGVLLARPSRPVRVCGLHPWMHHISTNAVTHNHRHQSQPAAMKATGSGAMEMRAPVPSRLARQGRRQSADHAETMRAPCPKLSRAAFSATPSRLRDTSREESCRDYLACLAARGILFAC